MQKNSVSYNQIMADLSKKIYSPVYFLYGEEPYYIDKISDFISKNVLTEEEKSFNQTVLYGKDVDAAIITNTAKRYPMMANHQVVIVKEAQETRNFEDLIHYIGNPLPSTILVLNYKYKPLDGRKKIFKTLQENAVVLQTKKLYNDKIPGWISERLKSGNYQIEPKAAMLLTEFLGNDLLKIENELRKLIITLAANQKIITSDHIERNIGISKDFNIFELQNALVEKNPVKTQQIIKYFAANQKNHHITPTITNLYFFFAKILTLHVLKDKSRQSIAAALKINPYFVSDYEKAARSFPLGKVIKIISLLREYDMKSKGSGNVSAGPEDLLMELTYKILH
ncbi:MAG: DNA polymerase III subunit delta [Bacteroidales bacterium]|nr:DNA polymerase III subunit delta [Bacteroidales bacterium]MCF8391339.1 DNA polymerase III subunit delta [Bacteroidales bacterium]